MELFKQCTTYAVVVINVEVHVSGPLFGTRECKREFHSVATDLWYGCGVVVEKVAFVNVTMGLKVQSKMPLFVHRPRYLEIPQDKVCNAANSDDAIRTLHRYLQKYNKRHSGIQLKKLKESFATEER